MTATVPIWGDGFCDDAWSDVVRARDLDACADDELIRFFPMAVDSSASALNRLRTMMEARLAAQRERARIATDAERGRPGPALLRHLVWNLAPAKRRAWACEDRALAHLCAVIPRRVGDPVTAFDPAMATAFAFHAGMHPAYLWPEAVLSHEREFAAGWLGLLARGRTALIPFDVAHYLAAALEPRALVGADDTLGRLLNGAHFDIGRLHARMCGRLRGTVFELRWESVGSAEPHARPGVAGPETARGGVRP